MTASEVSKIFMARIFQYSAEYGDLESEYLEKRVFFQPNLFFPAALLKNGEVYLAKVLPF